MKVLLLRAGALGDVLLLRPAIASLRRAGHQVTLLAPVASGSVLVGAGLSEVGRLIPWDRVEVAALLDDGGLPPGALRDELASFDMAVAYTRSSAIVRNLSALVPRVAAHDPLPPGRDHAALWLARPMEDLGIAVVEQPPILVATAEEAAAAQRWLELLPRGFLAVHPGSGGSSKNWPSARFARLLDDFSPRAPFLLVEGPADRSSSEPLRRDPRTVVAAGLSLRVLGATLAQAGAFVGNDSGVSHLAAAWGAPTVALFGPTEPEVWAPLGPRVATVRSDSRRLEDITVERVLGELRRLTGVGRRST